MPWPPPISITLLLLFGLHAGGFAQESRLAQGEDSEEPGILLPPDDKYNFVGETDPSTAPTTRWRKGRQGSPPPPKQISSNSFTIRGDSQPSQSQVGSKVQSSSSGGSGTYFKKNNCFGPRCSSISNANSNGNHRVTTPPLSNPTTTDDWTSYHYVLNKDVGHNGKRKNGRKEDRSTKRSLEHTMGLSLPFQVVRGYGKGKDSRDLLRRGEVPEGWVKLNPLLPEQYELFSLNATTTERHPNLDNTFSKRLGVELSPESFADRWGWSPDGPPGGSRLPSWLQDIRGVSPAGGNRRGDGGSSGDSKWVKLEPIPVAGVSISKWVPKGTPQEDLPSTSWPSRDPQRVNGIPWWEQVDKHQHQHQQRHPPTYILNGNNNNRLPPTQIITSGGGGGGGGWSNMKPSSESSPISWDRTPTNPWDEVIYPGGPVSATASWQKDKDVSYQPQSQQPWSQSTNIRRPPIATGSWSADNNNNRRVSNYPPSTNGDDARWVLVSNSRKVTVSAPGSNYGQRYDRPGFDKYNDFPFYEPQQSQGHRNGKNYKEKLQDEAFSRVNATLAGLAPVLNLRGTNSNINPTLALTSGGTTTSTTRKPGRNANKLPAFLKPYADDARANLDGNGNRTTLEFGGQPQPQRQPGRKGLMSINPVYAAVGAGMIPATMAAVLPMVLGKRRRRRRDVVGKLDLEQRLEGLLSRLGA
jgi:hypothetical protein